MAKNKWNWLHCFPIQQLNNTYKVIWPFLQHRSYTFHLRVFIYLIYLFFFYWVAPYETVSSDICGQRRPRSACASAQSDQGLHCPLTESLDTAECMNGKQRPGWYFAHAQDDQNLRIYRMFGGTFSLDTALVICLYTWHTHIRTNTRMHSVRNCLIFHTFCFVFRKMIFNLLSSWPKLPWCISCYPIMPVTLPLKTKQYIDPGRYYMYVHFLSHNKTGAPNEESAQPRTG